MTEEVTVRMTYEELEAQRLDQESRRLDLTERELDLRGRAIEVEAMTGNAYRDHLAGMKETRQLDIEWRRDWAKAVDVQSQQFERIALALESIAKKESP